MSGTFIILKRTYYPHVVTINAWIQNLTLKID